MMIDWQPIETAPKNPEGERSGPMVLVWDSYHHCVWTASWTTDTDHGTVSTGWWVLAGRKQLLNEKVVTHWAPLTPPAEGEE